MDFYKELNGDDGSIKYQAAEVPPAFIEDISEIDFTNLPTPTDLFLENTAAALFQKTASLAEELSTDEIKVSNAYSIKTNPDGRLIKLAHETGFFAEAISLFEARKALEIGFQPGQIILNGPAKWWNRELLPDESLYCVFCDSIEELNQVISAVEKGEL